MIKYTEQIQTIPQVVPLINYIAGAVVFGLICVVAVGLDIYIILVMRENDLKINAMYAAMGRPEGDGLSVFHKRFKWEKRPEIKHLPTEFWSSKGVSRP